MTAITNSGRPLGAAGLTALSIVVAGCGSTRLSSSDYQRQIQREGTKLAEVRATLSHRSPSLAKQARVFASARATLGRVAAELSRLNPPQLVESEHVGLIEGSRTLAAELKPLRQLARNRDPQLPGRTAAVVRSSRGLSEIEQAANRLEQHGYDVGTLPQ